MKLNQVAASLAFEMKTTKHKSSLVEDGEPYLRWEGEWCDYWEVRFMAATISRWNEVKVSRKREDKAQFGLLG